MVTESATVGSRRPRSKDDFLVGSRKVGHLSQKYQYYILITDVTIKQPPDLHFSISIFVCRLLMKEILFSFLQFVFNLIMLDVYFQLCGEGSDSVCKTFWYLSSTRWSKGDSRPNSFNGGYVCYAPFDYFFFISLFALKLSFLLHLNASFSVDRSQYRLQVIANVCSFCKDIL